MGNRAYIKPHDMDAGIYLQWNGGPDSVSAFLEYCEKAGFRPDSLGFARLFQVIGNWFQGGLSIALWEGPFSMSANPGDNGIYEVREWKVIRHMSADGQVQDTPETVQAWMKENSEGYDKAQLLKDISASMPAGYRKFL